MKTNSAWTYYLAGRYEEALQALKGVEATEAWPVLVIYVRLGRVDEAGKRPRNGSKPDLIRSWLNPAPRYASR